MKQAILYPKPKFTPQSFVGVKRVKVPSQSLSLRQIIARFVRREPLPTTKDGLYEDRFGDLEKLSHADIVEKMDRVEELKAQIDAFEKRQNAKAEKDAADKLLADKAKFESEVEARLAKQAREGKPAQNPAP